MASWTQVPSFHHGHKQSAFEWAAGRATRGALSHDDEAWCCLVLEGPLLTVCKLRNYANTLMRFKDLFQLVRDCTVCCWRAGYRKCVGFLLAFRVLRYRTRASGRAAEGISREGVKRGARSCRAF